MRVIPRLALLSAMIALPAWAADHGRPMSPNPAEPAASTAAKPWYKDKRPEEACWGDSTESDANLNEGSRITTEEILRILNPARS